jgi:hypothetical protein
MVDIVSLIRFRIQKKDEGISVDAESLASGPRLLSTP